MRRRFRFGDIQAAPKHDVKRPVLHLAVRGQQVAVRLDNDGTFLATFGGSLERGASIRELRDKLMKASRRRTIKVAVEAMVISHHVELHGKSPSFTPVVLTGTHATSGAALYHVDLADDKKTPTVLGQAHGREFFRRMTGAEQDKYRRLYHAKRAAVRAFDEFEQTVWIDEEREVRKAIDVKVEELERAEGTPE